MYYVSNKNDNYCETYAFSENLFTPEECDVIIVQCLKLNVIKGETGYKYQHDSIRKNNVSWLDPQNESLQWIYQRCLAAIKNVNDDIFEYDLTWGEDFQFTIYDNMEDHYTKHMDVGITGEMATRKLTFSVQLSDPEHYEGSRLLLHTGHEPIESKVEQGTINFFPSYILHEVTPLISGKRYALVGWVHGPKFR